MPWSVIFHKEFDAEFQALDEGLQDELLAHAKLLQRYGPDLDRPMVDTLKEVKTRQHEGVAFFVGKTSVARNLCL